MNDVIFSAEIKARVQCAAEIKMMYLVLLHKEAQQHSHERFTNHCLGSALFGRRN